MSDSIQALAENVRTLLEGRIQNIIVANGEVTVEVAKQNVFAVCQTLRDEKVLAFDQVVDLCGVDYLTYGHDEWKTEMANNGFSRGRTQDHENIVDKAHTERFAVVYHLLSYVHNHRIRVRAYVPDESMMVIDSVVDLWAGVNWFEREAFDLFGIIFEGHPDLRRILTDYGFVGHPFRKDFPLCGNVEMRYDPEKGRVVYEPVTIEPRVLVPRVIRTEGRADKTHEVDFDGAAQ